MSGDGEGGGGGGGGAQEVTIGSLSTPELKHIAAQIENVRARAHARSSCRGAVVCATHAHVCVTVCARAAPPLLVFLILIWRTVCVDAPHCYLERARSGWRGAVACLCL